MRAVDIYRRLLKAANSCGILSPETKSGCSTSSLKASDSRWNTNERAATPDKFKAASSAVKSVLTVFWNVNGVVHSKVTRTGATDNSELRWNAEGAGGT